MVAIDLGLKVHMLSNPIVLRAKTDSKANEFLIMSDGIVRLMVRKRIAWSIKHSRIVEVYRLFAGLHGA